MATYKVIQDIEAEDKLVGPFSLRQFIYAGIAAFCGYLNVISVMKGAPFLVALFAPPMLFCMFFSWPWSPDQPTEVWALARIRFMLKPRKRIWDQSGVRELVTITVPKKIEKVYTDGLSQNEVRSRLSALADTIDSRGWVIKNSNVNMSAPTGYASQSVDDSDRLVSYNAMPREVPAIDVQAADDILDEQNNPVAQQFDSMINASTQAHRQEIMQRMEQAGATIPAQPPRSPLPTNDYWFLNQPSATPGAAAAPDAVTFASPSVVQPGAAATAGPVAAEPTASEEALVAELKEQNVASHVSYSHLKNITPASERKPAPVQPPVAAVSPQKDAAILDLASNDDLNVATLAREAQKARAPKQPPDDEVVISLH